MPHFFRNRCPKCGCLMLLHRTQSHHVWICTICGTMVSKPAGTPPETDSPELQESTEEARTSERSATAA